MQFEIIKTVKQFEQLKKGDYILVQWSDYFVKHTHNIKSIMLYNIYENKEIDKEIICQRKDNHFFNYKMYLEGTSSALEVYKVII